MYYILKRISRCMSTYISFILFITDKNEIIATYDMFLFTQRIIILPVYGTEVYSLLMVAHAYAIHLFRNGRFLF